jgi:hypothetical protein
MADRKRQGEIGPDLFRHARLMGLEGLVSKYRGLSRWAVAPLSKLARDEAGKGSFLK